MGFTFPFLYRNMVKSESICFMPLILLLSLAVIQRNIHWKNDFTLWSDVLQKSSHKMRPHQKMGLILYIEKGNLDEAMKEMMIAIQLKPDAPELHNNMGIFYQRKGLLGRAIEEYNQAIRIKPDYQQAFLNLGTVYLEKGEFQSALDAFTRAIQLKPDDIYAYNNIGFVYSDMGEYEKAIEMHKRAVSIKHDEPTGFYGLALAYEGMGLKREAAGYWREYLRLAPPGDSWREEALRHIRKLNP